MMQNMYVHLVGLSTCEAQTEGVKMEKLEDRRDQFLIELQQLLEKYWPGENLSGN